MSGPLQFIFLLQIKMTKIIPIHKTCNPLQASVRQCICVRQDVDTGIINIPVLRKVYFYRISNLTLNKTFIMEFQHIRGEPLLYEEQIKLFEECLSNSERVNELPHQINFIPSSFREVLNCHKRPILSTGSGCQNIQYSEGSKLYVIYQSTRLPKLQ